MTALVVDRSDPRWKRIRQSITFVSSEIVADRHADYVYSIVERIPTPPVPPKRASRKPATPKKPVARKAPPVYCDDCGGMGYHRPSGLRCETCKGRATVAA